MKISEQLSTNHLSDEQELRIIFDAVFSGNNELVPIFKELLDEKLSEYSDEYITESVRLLAYWREDGVDYSKMDKLSIISERAKMI